MARLGQVGLGRDLNQRPKAAKTDGADASRDSLQELPSSYACLRSLAVFSIVVSHIPPPEVAARCDAGTAKC